MNGRISLLGRATVVVAIVASALAFPSSGADAADGVVTVERIGTSDRVRISWTPQPGNGGYNVYVTRDPDCRYGLTPGSEIVTGAEFLGNAVSSVVLSVPTTGRMFVQVYRFGSSAPDPVPMTTSFTLAAPRAPQAQVAVQRGPTTARLAVSAPQDCDAPRVPATAYNVLMRPGNRSWTIDAASPTLDIDGLDPNTTYTLIATAVSTEGVGRPATERMVPLPKVTFAPVEVLEGDIGGSFAVPVTVRLSQASTQWVTVFYETRDATATAYYDYQFAEGHVDIAPGATSATITVWVKRDNLAERNETFKVVADAIGAEAGRPARVKIRDDD